jgi:hypothetical protein
MAFRFIIFSYFEVVTELYYLLFTGTECFSTILLLLCSPGYSRASRVVILL